MKTWIAATGITLGLILALMAEPARAAGQITAHVEIEIPAVINVNWFPEDDDEFHRGKHRGWERRGAFDAQANCAWAAVVSRDQDMKETRIRHWDDVREFALTANSAHNDLTITFVAE